ncbi:XRE family transcriptional regulator [Plasticicumulans sp.]|uniref:XRE family transcriptional regulator n=1 Tax=Plasticicumulans sp. TaxID=2307179 RepID=UPI00321FCCFC
MNWLEALREACERDGQAAVARRLRATGSTYPSPTVISQALSGKYTGDLDRLRELVEGALLGASVRCPVIGDLVRNKCLEHQARERRFASANPLYVRLYRACRSGCPHSRLPKEY